VSQKVLIKLKIMQKRTVKQTKVTRPLKDKLLAAVSKVLTNNNSELTNKMEKIVKKSLRPISRKAKKQIKRAKKLATM
jgi:hypothetical protein